METRIVPRGFTETKENVEKIRRSVVTTLHVNGPTYTPDELQALLSVMEAAEQLHLALWQLRIRNRTSLDRMF